MESRHSGGYFAYTRRVTANAVALHRPTADHSATKFSRRRRFSYFPPTRMAAIFAIAVNTKMQFLYAWKVILHRAAESPHARQCARRSGFWSAGRWLPVHHPHPG